MADNEARPLFGETRKKDKIVNAVVAIVTTVCVIVTVIMVCISCFIEPNHAFTPNFLGYLFCGIIFLQLVPQVFVVMWYRRGELEPKFRRMIYYNAFLTVLLCAAVILYSFRVDRGFCALPSSTTCNKSTSTLTATVRPTTPHH